MTRPDVLYKVLVAPEGRWLQVNDVLCQIIGYDRQALLERIFQEVTHPDDLEADLELVRWVVDARTDG